MPVPFYLLPFLFTTGKIAVCLTPVTGPICLSGAQAAVNGVAAIVVGGIAVYNEWTDEDDDDGCLVSASGCSGKNKGKKGKELRGGKKKDRDQWGKYSGKKYKGFRKWWEKEKQKDGSLHDLETEEDRERDREQEERRENE